MNARAAADQPYPPIGEYALLGDCHSTALVSRWGSVDWASFRRFDAPSVFGRLLDWRRGGYFAIRARDGRRWQRAYIPGTLVLETTITTGTGTARLREALAMRPGGADHPDHQLLRDLEVLDGRVSFDVDFVPRFDYGLTRPLLRQHDTGTYSATGGNEALVLATDAALTVDRDRSCLSGALDMSAGTPARFGVLSQPAHRLDPSQMRVDDVSERLDATVAWWTDWSSATVAQGDYRDLCRSSAVVLKALTCAPTGAVIAAATTSLPEIVGGTRNWDYRYSWIRDSSLVLDALSYVGHGEVAEGFRDFLIRSSAGHADDLQIMYGAYGERRLPELALDLEGWRGSSPVRIGNDAAVQTQLDVYGHLLDAVHLWHGADVPLEEHERAFVRDAVDIVARRWAEPDHGIWELRGKPAHYVHSKVMCWVALDRGLRLAPLLDADAESVQRWRQAGDDIRAAIRKQGVDPARGCFTQHFGTTAVDASLLKLPLVGFIAADDPAMLATIQAIQSDLGEPNGLVRRFPTHGRVPEGVFLLCTFWLVENLALVGRHDEAVALYEQAIATGNDLGLFAEEFDVRSGALLGNFPQAFTHLGLIMAARRLTETQP